MRQLKECSRPPEAAKSDEDEKCMGREVLHGEVVVKWGRGLSQRDAGIEGLEAELEEPRTSLAAFAAKETLSAEFKGMLVSAAEEHEALSIHMPYKECCTVGC